MSYKLIIFTIILFVSVAGGTQISSEASASIFQSPISPSNTNCPCSSQTPNTLKTVSETIVSAIITLLAVITGGVITYLTTQAIERRKWQQDRRDKLQEKQREAVELALEWLEPMSKAISRAESLTSGLIFQRITEDHFRRNWPDLLSQLSNQDIPIQLRYRLSSNIYARGHQIIQELEKLQYLNLVSYPRDEGEFKSKLEECSKIIAHLNQILRELEDELIEEHKKTYQ